MRSRAILLAFALLSMGVPLAAQAVNVTANVPTRSPTGAGTRDLTFGVIMPVSGTVQTVDVPAAATPVSGTVQSGGFRYDVAALRGLDFSLSVPSVLTGSGTSSLNVSFAGVQYGSYCVAVGGGACTPAGFDPSAATPVRVCFQTLGNGNCHQNRVFPAGSELSVYVGGRLTIPPTALAGVYTATVTLTVVQVH